MIKKAKIDTLAFKFLKSSLKKQVLYLLRKNLLQLDRRMMLQNLRAGN